MKYKSIIIILITLINYSCEKTLKDVKLPEVENKIVVNSILTADTTINIHLTKNKKIVENDYGYSIISEAEIDLYENESLIGRLDHTGEGYYSMENFNLKLRPKH